MFQKSRSKSSTLKMTTPHRPSLPLTAVRTNLRWVQVDFSAFFPKKSLNVTIIVIFRDLWLVSYHQASSQESESQTSETPGDEKPPINLETLQFWWHDNYQNCVKSNELFNERRFKTQIWANRFGQIFLCRWMTIEKVVMKPVLRLVAKVASSQNWPKCAEHRAAVSRTISRSSTRTPLTSATLKC